MSFIKDLITLDVVTVTGEIHIGVTGDTTGSDPDGPSAIDFDALFKGIDKKLTTDSKMRVIAATRINIDKDTYNFAAEGLSDSDKELAALHFQSVDMAAKSRAEIVARVRPNFSRRGPSA